MAARRDVIMGLGAAAALAATDAFAQRGRRSKKPTAPPPPDPAVVALAALDPAARAKLDAALAGAHRSDKNKARDAFRKPAETLAFFGLTPSMAALEVIPAGGWFTEVLAPYLRDTGKLWVTAGSPNEPAWRGQLVRQLDMYAKTPTVYDQVRLHGAWLRADQQIQPASLDMIVTFRNVHNLVWLKRAEESFAEWAALLKPGGVLGIEDHRWPDGVPNTAKPTTPFNAPDNGYISEAAVIALAEKAGFKLAGKSEINANPKDTKDYAQGVWALPPTLIGGESDPNREKYVAIGESDRMTLKFVKA